MASDEPTKKSKTAKCPPTGPPTLASTTNRAYVTNAYRYERRVRHETLKYDLIGDGEAVKGAVASKHWT